MEIMPEIFNINDYLHHDFECTCGRSHHTEVEHVLISQGAMSQIPALLKEYGYRHVFIISDKNTHRAAGRRLEEILGEAGCRFTSYIISRDVVVPDEYTLGELFIHYPRDCDVIVGVGTGTINDMSKFMSHQLGIRYMIAATAPSMDGFASIGAALITGNLKTTYDARVPLAIIGDIDVLAKAPMNMLAAGVADILGKYTCLCDWHLSHIVTGEYFCPVIEGMVRRSLKQMMEQADQLKNRTPETIRIVMEALVLTGIAMSFAGNSRPASGSEHHMSHYWEMQFLFEGRPAVLHGTKVGIGTCVAVRLYQNLLETAIDYADAVRKAESFDLLLWEEEMRRAYGAAAEGVIANERTGKKNDPEKVKERLRIIEENMEKIKKDIRELVPPLEDIQTILKNLKGPVNPLELGIDREMTADCIVAAKEVRDRYTILQLLWDLGLLQEMAVKTADNFSQEIQQQE